MLQNSSELVLKNLWSEFQMCFSAFEVLYWLLRSFYSDKYGLTKHSALNSLKKIDSL